MNIINSVQQKKQAQLTLDQESCRKAKQEFQDALEAFFESASGEDYAQSIERLNAARSELILTHGLSLEDLARLADRVE